MAQNGEHFITAVDALHTLCQQLDEGEPVQPEEIAGAEENVSESRAHLRSGIYEFRKRRDRAATPVGAPLPSELIEIARMIEGLKQECGMDPESPTAIRNGRIMSIAYRLRSLAAKKEPT